MKTNKKKDVKVGEKKADKPEDRGEMLAKVWGKRKITRLNAVLKEGYCGELTVRELASIVLADKLNFPKGLDTPLCIGDFEGNFCTHTLGVTVGGEQSDRICIMGDPNAF